MIAGLEVWVAVACIGLVALGAAIQGLIGLGMGLLAAPLLGIVDPAFLPVTMVVAVIPLSVGVAYRERHAIERRQVAIALAGRLPGVVLGAWVATFASHRFIAAVVGVSVLVAVAGSITGFRFATTDRSLFVAGLTAGFTATSAGVGGPPMGLTYQHAEPATLRATLAAFFALGAMLSLVALVVAGQVGRRQIQLSALLLPAIPIGLWASRPLITRVPTERIRPLVLAVCAASAVALLVDEVL